MSHFDAVNYYTGDDFIPQDTTETNPRRIATATTQTGSQEMAPWAHKVMLELREYANNGGKLLVDGRNVHQTFTASGSSLTATGQSISGTYLETITVSGLGTASRTFNVTGIFTLNRISPVATLTVL